jgi:2-haloacid dehalogenase
LSKTRREFISFAGKTLGAGMALSSFSFPVLAVLPVMPKAILFDAFPIFDPRPVFALTERVFPGKGPELSNAWRTRQFEYTWLRNSMLDYKDFWRVTQDALVFAANSLKLDLTPEKRDRLMNAYLQLRVYPDVLDSLKAFRTAGIKLAFLSNFTVKMLQAGIASSGLESMFDHLLSTDQVRAFKPDARAYQMGVNVFKFKREEMLFAAFAGWDAVGAKKFGYPTFWVNRFNQPSEQLGFTPDGSGASLVDLRNFVIR